MDDQSELDLSMFFGLDKELPTYLREWRQVTLSSLITEKKNEKVVEGILVLVVRIQENMSSWYQALVVPFYISSCLARSTHYT